MKRYRMLVSTVICIQRKIEGSENFNMKAEGKTQLHISSTKLIRITSTEPLFICPTI